MTGAESSLLLSPLVIVLAGGLAWYLPDEWRPGTTINRWAVRLADKTNRSQRSAGQRRLAGGLAMALVMLPALLLVALASHWAAFPQLFSLALLAWLLPGQAWRRDRQRLQLALKLGNDTLARRHLAPWSDQDLQGLAQADLVSAGIETQLERQRDDLFTPLFWFLCAGPVGAAGSWLVLQLVRAWPPGRHGPFATVPHRLQALLQWPVNALMSLALDPKLPWRPRKALALDWTQRARLWPLRALAWRLHCQLGGPRRQHGQHQLRPRLGPTTQPRRQMLSYGQRLLDTVGAAALVLWTGLTLFLFG